VTDALAASLASDPTDDIFSMYPIKMPVSLSVLYQNVHQTLAGKEAYWSIPQNKVRNWEMRLKLCSMLRPSVQYGLYERLASRKPNVIMAPVASCPGPSAPRNTKKLVMRSFRSI